MKIKFDHSSAAVLAGVLTVLIGSGCAKQIRLPEDRVSAVYEVPHSTTEVAEAAVEVLAETLAGIDEDDLASEPGITFQKGTGNKWISVIRSENDQHLSCMLLEDYSSGSKKSYSGDAEQWNLTLTPVGGGTEISIYRHFRRSTKGIPVSDGKDEEEFYEKLVEVLNGVE